MKASRQKSGPSFADHVYNTLYRRISNGDSPPDGKLPPETALAAEICVSRPVLRDALERLRAQRLIVSRQGAGNFVRPHQARTSGYGRIETIADIQRCYEFRLTIEPQVARLAAERRNDEALANVSNALDLMGATTRAMLHREDADFAFHIADAHAANNTFLRLPYERCTNRFDILTTGGGAGCVIGRSGGPIKVRN